MKCDDDMFVNVPNLIHFLLGGTVPALNATLPHFNYQTVRTWLPINRFKYHENVLVGLLFCRHIPIMNHYNKWWVRQMDFPSIVRCSKPCSYFSSFCYSFFCTWPSRFAPRYLYDGEMYPNYLGGSGYVFTMDTAKKLYSASMNVPLFHLEDVYLTGKRSILRPFHSIQNFTQNIRFRGRILLIVSVTT